MNKCFITSGTDLSLWNQSYNFESENSTLTVVTNGWYSGVIFKPEKNLVFFSG